MRELEEYVAGHVPGARLLQLARLPRRAGELPAGEPVYVICASRNRSWTAARFLAQRGGLGARSVARGTGDWAARGLPVVRSAQDNAA